MNRETALLTLEDCRRRIDELDLRILGLLNERTRAVEQIGQAKQSLDLLPLSLGAETAWDTRLWRLDLLGEPLLAERAALEAAAADVIVLSLHGYNDLPVEACNWLNRWLHYKQDRPYALAALLDADPAHPGSEHPVAAYLQRVAQAARVQLFCSFRNAPDPASAFC